MLFNSLSFLAFFPLTTALYFLLPQRLRWMLLLACSCVFYAAFIPGYLLILALVIAIDFVAGLLIERSTGGVRRGFLILSLVANIGLLAVFKYFNFANTNLQALAHFLHWNYPIRNLGMVLPIGLSFHTFQSMAYTIEVYRGRQPAERNLGVYSLYVMFFPQLVAGPIERPQHLLHQFREVHVFDADRVFAGLKQMLWGAFKKVVIADRLSAVVDAIYANPSHVGGAYLILATWFFAIQIYCDFSGYSDIAIGAARVLGFRLITNFDRPYASQSVAEFWRRWHISLSTWFRDYLYIPLGGSRVALPRWCFNVMVVFLISGMWHGASWNFAVWGALHGVYLICSRLTALLGSSGSRARPAGSYAQIPGLPPPHIEENDLARPRAADIVGSAPRTASSGASEMVRSADPTRMALDYSGEPPSPLRSITKALRIFFTFNLVSFAWFFFRAPTLTDAWTIIRHIPARHFWATTQFTVGSMSAPAFTSSGLNISFALIALLFIAEWMLSRGDSRGLRSQPVWIRWPAYYCLGLLILWIGALGGQPFIYFQF